MPAAQGMTRITESKGNTGPVLFVDAASRVRGEVL
jgi:hypothetical protein